MMGHVVPSIEDELTRKALNRIRYAYSSMLSGRITQLEYKMAIETLFEICSGITNDEFFKVITEASKQIRKDSSFNRHICLTNGKKCVEVIQTQERVIVREIKEVQSTSTNIEDWQTLEEVHTQVKKVINQLTKKGFREYDH